jgi:alpha-L-fucosidase
MQCVSAVTVEAVTPEAPMTTCPNGVYKVISSDNGQALDANGINDNTALDVSAYNNSDSQHWTLTGIGGGIYKLIGAGSGKFVNVSGNSGDDNAPIILWDYNNAANELVYLSSPAAGYYSMFFVTSGTAVTVALGSIIQSAYTGANNQRWQFLKP